METVNILVVTDCQEDFCSGSLGTAEAQATVPAIVEKVKAASYDDVIVIATMDTHGEDYLETNEGRHLPVPHTIRNTKGWRIVPEIKEQLDAAEAEYIYKDRFGSLDLASHIRAVTLGGYGITERDGKYLVITVIGWCTDICVISNALILKAVFPEARIIVDSACCAGVTPEAHKAALMVLKSCQVEVI